MLNHIVALSLRYKLLVLVAFVLIAVLGVRAWQRVPLDAFPDVTPVQVNIYTESPGLAAEDVEKLVTFPVESAVAGLPKVEEIRSTSLFGLSYVSVFFKDDMDVQLARRLVSEKLVEAKSRLPEGYGEPTLGPNASGLGQVFWYTLEAMDKKLSGMDLRSAQDWGVRMILRTTPGVDDVISWGGDEKQFQVLIDPRRLIKYGLGYKEVMAAINIWCAASGGSRMRRTSAASWWPSATARPSTCGTWPTSARRRPCVAAQSSRTARRWCSAWRSHAPARMPSRWWKQCAPRSPRR